jgi:radical SAM superfamily enzyme YgiQ (UPF0313 family)
MKVLFVYPAFNRHGDDHPELLEFVPMNEYLGSPSLGIASLAAVTPDGWEVEFRDDRLVDGAAPTDADLVALSFFTPAASRGLEIADAFRAMGKPVVAGGIFPTAMPELVAEHVDTVVVGEGDAVWPQILRDLENGAVKARYQNVGAVDLDRLPPPDVGLYIAGEGERFQPDDYPLQISRGCALSCHACILPTSMTANMRTFSLEHVLAQLDALQSAGKRACLTEDTSWFPAHKGRRLLEQVLDHIIASGRPAPISYIGISMPMILTTPTRLFDKARAAGIDMFYLVGGFDPVTKGAFTGTNDRMLQKAKDAIRKAWDVGIEPYTSFLLGGDQDDPGTADRMLEFADDANIRKAEFAIATPYPGTPQWHTLNAQDRILTREWRKYNDANVVFQPAQMTPDQVGEGYLHLWREFYRHKQYLADLPIGERTIQF